MDVIQRARRAFRGKCRRNSGEVARILEPSATLCPSVEPRVLARRTGATAIMRLVRLTAINR
jgi:hypothetical protein